MKKPITITLAEQGYEIEQLNLMQLRDLNVGVVKATPPDPLEKVVSSFDDALETIQTALRVKHPDMVVAKMYEMPITEDEMVVAVRDILKFAGLLKEVPVAEGSQTGEAAAAASTGDGSSVASAAA